MNWQDVQELTDNELNCLIATTIQLKTPDMPDYCNDLNAIHEAEKYLDTISNPASSRRQPNILYKLYLMRSLNNKRLWDNGTFLGSVYDGLKCITATARQRAEAFILAAQRSEDE